jgi:chemotaxis protein MotB
MKNIIKILIVGGIATSSIFSCVPKRKLDDVTANYNTEKAKSQELHSQNVQLESENSELENRVEDINKRIKALKNDTSIQGTSLRQLTSNYDQLDNTYRELLNLKDLNKKKAEELVMRYMKEIENTRNTLQIKEDKLNDTEISLAEKEANLKLKTLELNQAMADIDQRAKRISELQSEITRRDSLAKSLANKIRNALFGLEDEGITMEMRNGKVYISLDNELLFKPGSYKADDKGKQALKKLAKALKGNNDINITVEGHTDTDKYNGGPQLKDNWDLSVMRGTEIVKVLESFKVNPKRLTASGKGQHSPLDLGKNSAAKKKNRRTDIVLTPRLDVFEEILKD